VRLLVVDIGRLSGLRYKLVCCFKLLVDMVGVASGRLGMMWTDQNLETVLMELGVGGYR